MSEYLPHISISMVVALLGLGGYVWRITRGIVTKEDMKEQDQILHTRIDKVEREYQKADSDQTNALGQRITTLDANINGRLARIEQQEGLILEALLNLKK